MTVQQQVILRDASASDLPAVIALNDAAVKHTSAMDLDKLNHLQAMASYFKVAERDNTVLGFLLAINQGQPYQNDNYAWFSKQYERFTYIDRVVVSADAAGQGVGTELYNDLIAFAQATESPRLTCEFNIDPPNLASDKFHAKLGFTEVGQQVIDQGQGSKTVSLQALEL